MIRSRLGRFVPVGPRDSLVLLLILAVPTGAFAQTADDRQDQLQFKLSGFENLVGGSASEGKGGAAGGSSESEIELTPQYKTTDGTVFAARGVLNLVAASFVSSSYPVFDIWRAHQYADIDEQLAQVDLAKGSQNVLISRPGALEVGVALLGPGDAAFLTAVVGHLPFGVACEGAVLAEVGYNLGSGLGDLVVARAFAALAKKSK